MSGERLYYPRGTAPEQPLIAVTSRALTPSARRRWQFRLTDGIRTVCSVVFSLLVVFLFLSGVEIIAMQEGTAAERMTAISVMIAVVLLYFYTFWYDHAFSKKAGRRRLAERSDRQTEARITFYGDRVVRCAGDSRWEIPYTELTVTETAAGIALQNKKCWFVIRGEDTVAYDLQLIREFLQDHVPASAYRTVSPAVSRLAVPLPLAAEKPPEQPIVTARLGGRRISETARRIAVQNALLFALAAVLLSEWWWFIGNYFLDLALWLVLCEAVGFLITWPIGKVLGCTVTEPETTVRFEPSGLRVCEAGEELVIPRTCVQLTASENALTVSAWGERSWTVPYEAADNPQQLRALTQAGPTVG